MSVMARMPRGERSSVRLTKLPAALLMRCVAGRPPSHIAATARSTASGSLMSTTCQVTRSAPMAAAASCSTGPRRPQISTAAPRESSFSAIIRPRPPPPPVTSTRWPANRSALNIAPSRFPSALCCPQTGGKGRAMADRKVVLVTGGGRGIGAAVVRLAAARGWDVAFTYAGNAARAAETEAAAKAAGAKVLAMQADVGDPQAVAATFAAVRDRFGRLDALVNNAGITGPKATLRESTGAIWDRVLRVNVIGLAACCREALAMLPEGGAIVNVS